MKNSLLILTLWACGSVAFAGQTKPLPSPLTLEDALSYALSHNPELTIVKEQLKEQKGILVQTTALSLPSITANASYQQVDRDLQETSSAWAAGQKSWAADVTLRQTLFAGGSVMQGVRASYAQTQAASARVTSAIEATVYSVKEAFYRVLVDRQIISVREESLQVLEEQLKNVQAKYDAGVASEFERLQAQVAVANERPSLIRAQNDYRIAVQTLLSVLGASAKENLSPEDVQGELKPELLSVELIDLLAKAEVSRADIRAANRDFAAAQSSVWAARGAYLPTVVAFGGYDWQKSTLTSKMDDYIDGWSFGVKVSVPVFNSFSDEAKVASAKARRRQASAAELKTRLGVAVEVRQAYSQYDQAKEILSSSEQVVEQARESLRMAKARYAAGSSTQLDVLQAQSAFSQARLSHLQAQYDTIVAVARLQKATGCHDWQLKVTDKTQAKE